MKNMKMFSCVVGFVVLFAVFMVSLFLFKGSEKAPSGNERVEKSTTIENVFRSKIDMIKEWERLRMDGTKALLPSLGSMYYSHSVTFSTEKDGEKVNVSFVEQKEKMEFPLFVQMAIYDGVSEEKANLFVGTFLGSALKKEVSETLKKKVFDKYKEIRKTDVSPTQEDLPSLKMTEDGYELVLIRFPETDTEHAHVLIELRPIELRPM